MRPIAFILMVLSLLVLAACGGATTTTTSAPPSSTPTALPATATVTQQPAKVGDTISVDGVHVTLVSVKTIQPSQYDSPPAAGNSYFLVHIAITNLSATVKDYNAFDFTVFSGAGASAGTTFLSNVPSNSLLSSGQLAPNGHVEGDLLVELPTHDHGATLVWRPNFLDNSLTNVWSLGL